jgi:acetyl-CoA acetyltransferase
LNTARNAWLQRGLPLTTTLQSGSVQPAIGFAAAQIATGPFDIVIGSGVEHMGHISFADVDALHAQHRHP